MFYLSIIIFYIAGILFFSSVKITYTGGNIMNFRVTDPTILWAAVGSIIVGVVGAIFFLYRESRHTKEIQETTTESKTVLLRHDALTDKILTRLDSRTENGFSELRQYIASQQALLQKTQNTNLSMGEVFSYIETAVTRANETAQLNRECEGLMRENEELRQTVREQEAALHELQEQIRNLTIQLGREAEIDDPEIGMAECQLPHLIQ